MELRIKDLESELSKAKILQEDSHKAELEKYKQLPSRTRSSKVIGR